MKKISVLFLAVIIFLQMSTAAVAAETSRNNKITITVSEIDTSMLIDGSPRFSTEIKVNGFDSASLKIIGEKWTRPEEFIISGEDIPLKDGKYSYELRIRTDGTLNFNNDLEILYQGIDGHYQLDYTIDETDNHIMIVTGLFQNIITESPALNVLPEKGKNWVQNNVDDDSYEYELNLRTQEGFIFANRLQFNFRSVPYVYSVGIMYDLLKDTKPLIVNGATGSDLPDYENLITENVVITDNADKKEVYAQYVEQTVAENRDLINEAVEKAETISGISKEEVVNRVEEYVSDHQEIIEEYVGSIDIDELENRVSSFFGSLGY